MARVAYCCRSRPLRLRTVACLLLLAVCAAGQDQVVISAAGDDELPSDDVCAYDSMSEGCPGSLGMDARRAACNCGYEDNTWFHVLGTFVSAFRTGPTERSLLAQRLDVRSEANGLISMNVGYTERLQCGAAVADAYPGTDISVNLMQVYRLVSNFIYPNVQNELNRICLPGRMALQLFCLHAELLRKNFAVAKAYAVQLGKVHGMLEECVQGLTPWPFPGLDDYVKMWKDVTLPEDSLDPSRLAWWPSPAAMRAKLPHESEAHYWPCVEMKDPTCFPMGSDNLYTSCSSCCDPGRGPTGNAECFVGEWTFARCCRTPGGSGRFY